MLSIESIQNRHFHDPYAPGGLAEKRHVFVTRQQVGTRLAASRSFVVGELGFGLGLTMLALYGTLLELPDPPHLTLHTYELYPRPWSELLALWKQAAPESPAIPHLSGAPNLPSTSLNLPQTSLFPHFTLHIYHGDATQTLPQSPPFLADAWCLDGHAPAKNPALWAPALMQEVFARTRSGGTAATYSAARSVRDALTQAGFRVEKTRGFPPKRDALLATKE